MQFERILYLFGYFVQTMPNLRTAHMSSLHFCKAQTDKYGASTNIIDFLSFYWDILSLERDQNCINVSKVMVIWLNFTEQLVSCHEKLLFVIK